VDIYITNQVLIERDGYIARIAMNKGIKMLLQHLLLSALPPILLLCLGLALYSVAGVPTPAPTIAATSASAAAAAAGAGISAARVTVAASAGMLGLVGYRAAGAGKKKRNVEGEAAGGKGKTSLTDKYTIVMALQKKTKKASKLAKEYNISESAISQMKKNADRIIKEYNESSIPAQAKRIRKVDPINDLLDADILAFVELARKKFTTTKLPISGGMLMARANKVAAAKDFKANGGKGA
jgi:hypothetical protein